MYQSIFTLIGILFISFSSFGQFSATHSTIPNVHLCSSSTQTITFSNTSNFTSSDSIFILLPNSSYVSSGTPISVNNGTYTVSNDTVIVHSLPSASSVILSYTLSVDCDAYNANTYAHSENYSFALNSGSWTAQSTNSFNISSPTLNFIGGNQLHFNNAFLGQGVTREFYFTNTNTSVPFNGVVRFCDTLP